jgi:hypothetical protein
MWEARPRVRFETTVGERDDAVATAFEIRYRSAVDRQAVDHIPICLPGTAEPASPRPRTRSSNTLYDWPQRARRGKETESMNTPVAVTS